VGLRQPQASSIVVPSPKAIRGTEAS